ALSALSLHDALPISLFGRRPPQRQPAQKATSRGRSSGGTRNDGGIADWRPVLYDRAPAGPGGRPEWVLVGSNRPFDRLRGLRIRSEEHTSELQSPCK